MVRQYIDNESIRFIRLQPFNKVKSFDCGDADLNDFILNRATLFDKYMLAVSYTCVDICAKNQKLGTQVLNIIKSMFVINNKTGCRFITVDAYLAAVPFYEKNGFRMMNLEDNDPHTRLMYFDLMDLVA
ncbi:GNAT family N-acetyltransferase [Fibrobacter sp.]|uniref:GNAT family N-acetyltransferase n=1 Tax=Fibrobacter sp. TaxID=35828 RepID=UPI0025BBCA98|nr:GNAT family N-acetyltransferase [Fibrobacter sp.]MBR3070764.1 GNAT family N-acetyltransferase [Fibrobacter sp.]